MRTADCSLAVSICTVRRRGQVVRLIDYDAMIAGLNMSPGAKQLIMITCPYDLDPLTPHFYILNCGLQGYT